MKTVKVLYIEDDRTMRAMIGMALDDSSERFILEECETGQCAIQTAQAAVFNADLILLDYLLPDMNGIEILTALRRIPGTAKTPTIVMSGEDTDILKKHFCDLNVLGILQKPIDIFRLPHQVLSLLAGSPGHEIQI